MVVNFITYNGLRVYVRRAYHELKLLTASCPPACINTILAVVAVYQHKT